MVKAEPPEGSHPGPYQPSGGYQAPGHKGATVAPSVDESDEEVVDDEGEDEREGEDDDDDDSGEAEDGHGAAAGHGDDVRGHAPQQAETADAKADDGSDGLGAAHAHEDPEREVDGVSSGDAGPSGSGGAPAALLCATAAATTGGGSRKKRVRQRRGSVRTAADGPLMHLCFYCNQPSPNGELTRCCSCTPVSLEYNCHRRCHLRCAAKVPGQLLPGFEELGVWFCGCGRQNHPKHTPENHLKVVNASNPEADAVRAYVQTCALLLSAGNGAGAAAAQAAGGGAQGPGGAGSGLPTAWFAPDRVRARGRGLVPDPQQPGRVIFESMLTPQLATAGAAAAGAAAAGAAAAGAASTGAAAGGAAEAAGASKQESGRSGSERTTLSAEHRVRGSGMGAAAVGRGLPGGEEEAGAAAAPGFTAKPDPDQQHNPPQRGVVGGMRHRSLAQRWQPVTQAPPERSGAGARSGSAAAKPALAAASPVARLATAANGSDAAPLSVAGGQAGAVSSRSDDRAGAYDDGWEHPSAKRQRAEVAGAGTAGAGTAAAAAAAAAGSAAELAALRAQLADMQQRLADMERALSEEQTRRIRAEVRAEGLEEQRQRYEQEARDERERAMEARVAEAVMKRQVAELEKRMKG